MWLNWNDWKWWDDNRWKTWINLDLESRLMRWRDWMRALNRAWINATELLLAWATSEWEWVDELMDVSEFLPQAENSEEVTIEELLSEIWDAVSEGTKCVLDK